MVYTVEPLGAVDTWLAGTELAALDWEQRKHERLLAA